MASNNTTNKLASRMTNVAAFLVTGKFFALLINAITFLIIARILGPSNYGIYTIVMSVAALLGGFGNPNLGAYISERAPKLISANKKKETKLVFGDTLILSLIIGIILTAIGLIFGTAISEYTLHTTAYVLILDLGIATIFFSLLYSTLNSHLLSLNKGKSLASTSILHASTQALFGITLVFLGFGIGGAISGFLAGLIFGTIFEFYIIIKSTGIAFNLMGIKTRFKKILLFSKDIAYSNVLSTAIGNFSVIFLGLIVSAALVGDYGIASRIGSLIDVFVGSIAMAILPMFSEAIYRQKSGANAGKLFFYSTYMSILFGAPIILLFVVFSKQIITVALSSTYLAAVPYMQLISIGILIGIFGSYGTNFLISSSKQSKILKYTALSVFVQFIALFILTPILGVSGMIIAIFFIGSIISDILYINYLSKSGIKLHRGKFFRLMLANILFVTILFLVSLTTSSFLSFIVGFALIFVLYPILVGKLGAILRTDIEILKTASESVPILGHIMYGIIEYASRFCS